MKKLILYGCLGILGIIIPTITHARPVSYPGGWTLMQMNNGDANSLHIHSSPTAKYSIGYRGEYMRREEYLLNAAQANILLKRWNKPAEQANLYLKSGAGVASKRIGEDQDALAVYSGIAADWETRRWFTSYENRGLLAGDIDHGFSQKARVGVAPYIADYGGFHTWVMVEARHNPKTDDPITITPLLRFFTGPTLIEAGYSSNDRVLFNFIHRF